LERSTNPKSFVRAAHALGMRVILDWVANHTAWDSSLVTDHPSGTSATARQLSSHPWWDWSDIIDLDYRHEGLRRYMTDAMKYWVREATSMATGAMSQALFP